MTSASIFLAIAVATWGPVAQSLAPGAAPGTEPPPSAAPAAGGVEPIAPSPSGPPPTRPALIAKAPLDVRMTPVLVDEPDRPRPTPLYKKWSFWLISGGLLTTTVIVTILATRPKPQPYIGNAPPFSVGLP